MSLVLCFVGLALRCVLGVLQAPLTGGTPLAAPDPVASYGFVGVGV